AWVASRGDDVVPLIGAKRRNQLTDGLAGISLELAEEELRAIEMAVPAGAVSGERYAPAQMASLDSEQEPT
ncbi:MAG: aldo/keto reductase, partial [Solirubrobacteraceae bacterium]